MATTQNKRRLVERYEIDTLGAPFKVTLLNCVSLSVDVKTGDEKINVPDVVGLIGAVVRERVRHPRKLNGDEIRFVRNSLGIKSNQIAKFLGMSAEHFSRCEAGAKVMALTSEKIFRLFAFLATYFSDPQDVLIKIIEGKVQLDAAEVEKQAKKPDDMAKKFIEQFLTMKIESAFDTSREIHFEFRRELDVEMNEPSDNDNEEWTPQIAACQ